MKFRIKTLMLSLAALLGVLATSCSDDDAVQPTDGYGYLQVKLSKIVNRGLLEGTDLNQLSDAKKIELSLLYNQKVIKQTLNLSSTGQNGAEYMLTSENLKLQAGQYTVTGYVIYGAYQEGSMADILQGGVPDGDASFVIQPSQLTNYSLQLHAVQYGTFSATLTKLLPEVRATGEATYSDLFSYDDIDSVSFVFSRNVGGATYREEHKAKAWRYTGDRYFNTDSITLQAGDYTLVHYELFNKKRKFMYAQDLEQAFTVNHFTLTEQEVDVQIPMSEAIADYIALRQIWDAMDGEHWSFTGDSEASGANWLFRFSDGTPRPVDAWGNQPGVGLGNNGRVVSLNLGAFNPRGVVPDAIGQLTALQTLYLGTHDEEFMGSATDGMEGVAGCRDSPYARAEAGVAVREHRMDIARERTAMRLACRADRLYPSRLKWSGAQPLTHVYLTTYSQGIGDPANRITGISEQIGNLTNLEVLYIANAQLKRLPQAMARLSALTDLELFNLPLEELDPEMFAGMTNLVSLNMSGIYGMAPTDLVTSMEGVCRYCSKLQLWYMNDNKLPRLPHNLPRLTDLRLLDAAFNKISTLESIQPVAPVQLLLDYNEIREFPLDFCGVNDLETFSAQANQLQQFPSFISNKEGMYTISTVDLSTNKMHGFQTGFKGIRVETLKLGMNEMGRREGSTEKGTFPREFADTQSEINYLVLEGNNIDTITNAALKNLKTLQALDCSGNHLKGIPSGWNSENFPYLTGVEMSDNEFRGFPTAILNVMRMQQLYMTTIGYYKDEAKTKWVRTMTEWPTDLNQHPGLLVVDFTSNDFRTVGKFPSNVNQLIVNDNPNIKMTVPAAVVYRIMNGTFGLGYDEDQDITFEQL